MQIVESLGLFLERGRHVWKVDVERVDLLDTHTLQTRVEGFFNRGPFQLAKMVWGQGQNLRVDGESLRGSFGLSDQFLGAPRRSGRISAGGIEVGDIVLFEIIKNFLDIFKINKVHAKGGSTEDELWVTHVADGDLRKRWKTGRDQTKEGGAINTINKKELNPDGKGSGCIAYP